MARFILVSAILLGLLIAWLINMDLLFSDVENKQITQQTVATQQAVNECIQIAENSVAHLEVVVEFQQLEKAGRQARVMRLCMHDHGFVQSKQWIDYATGLANVEATKKGISFDEAFENLRRAHMVMLTLNNGAPAYWQTQP